MLKKTLKSGGRFLIGTLLLERIIRIFGQARRDRIQSAWYPNLASFIKCAEKSPVRFSATQATHLVVSLGSVLHGLFFLIMGLRGGFPALFIAHMVAAFSRALMSGETDSFSLLLRDVLI